MWKFVKHIEGKPVDAVLENTGYRKASLRALGHSLNEGFGPYHRALDSLAMNGADRKTGMPVDPLAIAGSREMLATAGVAVSFFLSNSEGIYCMETGRRLNCDPDDTESKIMIPKSIRVFQRKWLPMHYPEIPEFPEVIADQPQYLLAGPSVHIGQTKTTVNDDTIPAFPLFTGVPRSQDEFEWSMDLVQDLALLLTARVSSMLSEPKLPTYVTPNRAVGAALREVAVKTTFDALRRSW